MMTALFMFVPAWPARSVRPGKCISMLRTISFQYTRNGLELEYDTRISMLQVIINVT